MSPSAGAVGAGGDFPMLSLDERRDISRTIVEAADGLEAWDHLEESSFDLLLTDWNMPNMSGFELLQLVRQTPSTADMPVVMLTTRNNKQDVCEREAHTTYYRHR